MNNDMIFDASEFDFTSLKDVVGFDAEPEKKAPLSKDELNTMGGVVDDISDLIGDYSPEEKKAYDDTEEDYNSNTDDLVPEETRNGVNLTDYFNNTNDDAYINFDGVSLTKKELKTLFNQKSRIEDDSTFLRSQADKFDADNRMIMQRALMQQNVLEQNISIYQNRLANPNITDTDYAQTSRSLQTAQQALYMYQKEANEIMSHREQQQQQINGYRIRVADQTMSNDHPEWNRYKGEILNYAQSMGIPGTVLEKNYDVGLMKIAMKAFMYDKGRKELNERLKANQVSHAKSTTGAKTSTRTAQEEQRNSQRKAQAIKNMGSSRTANAAAFDFLVD